MTGVQTCALPISEKQIPYVDEQGSRVEPDGKNGIKFEMFVFDALPEADGNVLLEVDRENEFAPVKNARGEDSPQTAVTAFYRKHANSLEKAGVKVPRDEEGAPLFPVEVDFRLIYNPELLREKAADIGKISAPLLLEK